MATKLTLINRVSAALSAFKFGSREETVISPEAFFPSSSGSSKVIYAGSFDGEKNLGEAGPIKYLLMDYYALSVRSWEAYITSAECQTVINKFCTWVIGKGLKLQCEPVKAIVGKIDKNFSDMVEARFSVYKASKMGDYSGLSTLNQVERDAYKNAIVSGDLLVILRYVDKCVKVQLIDGAHVQSPMAGSEWFPQITESGNRVINGVEINGRGEHVAYYVRKPYDSNNPLAPIDFDRIKTRTNNGLRVAYMVYGSKFRPDNQRGIPLIAAVIEKLKSIDRYEQATLTAAEEQNKINYQVVHQIGTTGEFPWAKQIAKARDVTGNADLPSDDLGRELANTVYATTNKQTVNNPVGAEVKPLRSNESQLYFKEFLEKNIDIVCAAIEIPPNVAMSKYDNNYSASRAAIKDWEHTLTVKRADFSAQFLKPIYDFWLEVEILLGNISAPGYLLAKTREDYMFLEAYRTCRFVGAPVANIDPAKEVEAERLKLGITAESIPLTTVEAATEILNGGDSDHNMEQFAEELEKSKSLGLRPEPEVQQTSNVSDK